MNGNTTIRLDERAHELFYDASLPDANNKRGYVFDRVRSANLVIDKNDQVIKSRGGQVPRPATMNDIEHSELIQG